MKIWQWTIWTSLVSLFLLNQYIERILHIQISFLYSYFDDLLVVPITLGGYQILMTDIFGKKNYRITPAILLFCVTGFIFHFEFLMPKISARYTADAWDVLMYIIGGIFYLVTFCEFISFRKKLHYEKI